MRKSGVWWIGKRVKIYYQDTQAWVHGSVMEYEAKEHLYRVQLDDGKDVWKQEQNLFLESKEENHKLESANGNSPSNLFSHFQIKRRKHSSNMPMLDFTFDLQRSENESDLVTGAEGSPMLRRIKRKSGRISPKEYDEMSEEQVVSPPNGSSENEAEYDEEKSADDGSELSDSGDEKNMYIESNAAVSTSAAALKREKKRKMEQVDASWENIPESDLKPQSFPPFDPPSPVLICNQCRAETTVEHKDFDLVPAPGDRSYVFKCSKCVGGVGKLQHLPKTWTEVALTAVYNLELIHRRQYFHSKVEICDFVDKNWATMCTGKTRTSTWWATLHAQITQNRHLFRTVSYGSGYWGILHDNENANEPAAKMHQRTKVAAASSPVREEEKEERIVQSADDADPNYEVEKKSAVIIFNRVKGSSKGVTCHQCRNRKTTLMSCTEQTCTKRYCEGCLDKHYGLKIYDLMKKTQWTCMNCRKCCSCISCKRGRGELPPFQNPNKNGKNGKPGPGRPSSRRIEAKQALKDSKDSDMSEDIPLAKRRRKRSDKRSQKDISIPTWRPADDDDEQIPEVESESEGEEDTSDERFAKLHKEYVYPHELGLSEMKSQREDIFMDKMSPMPYENIPHGAEIVNDIDISDLHDIKLDMLLGETESFFDTNSLLNSALV